VTNDDERLHALYRIHDRRDLLYVGRSNEPIRRANEHGRGKPWMYSACRIDVEWWREDEIAEAERRAIESEHPRYNVLHNQSRLEVEVEVSAEVRLPSVNELAGMIALGAVAVPTVKWR